MAREKIKATYSLDVETVKDLEHMASRLKISKSADSFLEEAEAWPSGR